MIYFPNEIFFCFVHNKSAIYLTATCYLLSQIKILVFNVWDTLVATISNKCTF